MRAVSCCCENHMCHMCQANHKTLVEYLEQKTQQHGFPEHHETQWHSEVRSSRHAGWADFCPNPRLEIPFLCHRILRHHEEALARGGSSIELAAGNKAKGRLGGVWAEFDARFGEAGWVLVHGPGFGLAGPALIDAAQGDDLLDVRVMLLQGEDGARHRPPIVAPPPFRLA